MKSFQRVWLSISLIAIGIGLGLIIIAAASGARWRDASTFSMNESYEGVENIDMDVNYGNVKIVEGNEFSISADNLPKDEYDSYVSDGTWYMKEKNGNHINLFGLKLSVGNILYWNDNFSPDITITIPKDFTAGNFILNVGAGYVEAEEIHALEGEFTVGAGELHINQLTVDNKSMYKIGTGEMELKNLTAKNITVEGGIGDTEIDGVVTGDNSIKCGIGHISIKLNGDKEDYSYEVTSGIGEIEIDGDSYNNISNKIIHNNDADNYLNLDSGIGNITVDFN